MFYDREESKLELEALENRIAPLVVVPDPLPEPEPPPDPVPPPEPPCVEPDQPGKSDGNRNNMWKKSALC